MTRNLVLIAIFLLAYSSYSQTQFLNRRTNEPIANVKIFNQEGEILNISNSKGIIQLKTDNTSENDSINIFHSNFNTKYLTYGDLIQNKKILLEASYLENLEPVLITTEKPRFLKITGYYLSYQLIDKKPQSFSDGIIEYYIDLKKSKVLDYNIKNSRLFKDQNYIIELKKEKPKAISMLGSNIRPFRLEEEILINEWENKNAKFSEILDKDWIGSINTKNNESNLTIEYYTPDNPRTISLLGLKTTIDHQLIQEKFNSEKPQIENIETIAKYYSSKMEKKGDKINYELEQDFFVKNLEYMNKEQLKLDTEELNHETGTNFSFNFWESYQNIIPPSINNKLYSEMELIKN